MWSNFPGTAILRHFQRLADDGEFPYTVMYVCLNNNNDKNDNNDNNNNNNNNNNHRHHHLQKLLKLTLLGYKIIDSVNSH